MKKVAISQSNYIPWKGYFDLIDTVDVFVFYDTAQYTKGDWRNRNKILSYDGIKWITISVTKKECLNKKINEIRITRDDWFVNHLNQIKEAYKKAPFFKEVFGWLEKVYLGSRNETYLSKINKHFILAINEILEIKTLVIDAESFEVGIDKNQKLIDICLALGATHYLSGPAAQSYIDTQLFNRQGIIVEWMNYNGYPKYPQIYGEFEHELSILDILFNVGLKDAKSYFKKRK